jgi:hypothetical protein
MKILYKNITTLEEENMYDVYRVLTKPAKMKYIWWSIICIISSCAEYFLGINQLWSILLFLWILLLALWLYFSFIAHKKRAKNFINQQKSILNVDKLVIELTFYEDKVKEYNPSSKWNLDFSYDKFDKIVETNHYFMLCSQKDKNKFIILTDKNWFTQWDSKTFKEFINSKIKPNKELKESEESKKAK